MKIILIMILVQLSTFAFTLVGSSIATYSQSQISVYIGDSSCSGLNDSPEELRDLTIKAVEKFWNRVSTSELELDVKGLKNIDASFYTDQICSPASGCVPAVDDGILIVCNNNGTTFSSAGKLAVTLPNNISGSYIKGVVIAINAISTTKFNDLSENEKVSAIAHEIGHAFGLGHSQIEDSLMYASSRTGRNRLGRDDWDGATFLYPKDQGVGGLCGSIIYPSDSQGPNKIMALLIFISILVIHLKMRLKKI